MKKGKRLIKRAISLLLVLLFSINSFAAIVSDNDGSAFITKAEFDSLKNDFQAQIDNYNTSIDSKIDGAIAAYLAGIRLASESIQDILDYYEKGIISIDKTEKTTGSDATSMWTPTVIPVQLNGRNMETRNLAWTSGIGSNNFVWTGVQWGSNYDKRALVDGDINNQGAPYKDANGDKYYAYKGWSPKGRTQVEFISTAHSSTYSWGDGYYNTATQTPSWTVSGSYYVLTNTDLFDGKVKSEEKVLFSSWVLWNTGNGYVVTVNVNMQQATPRFSWADISRERVITVAGAPYEYFTEKSFLNNMSNFKTSVPSYDKDKKYTAKQFLSAASCKLIWSQSGSFYSRAKNISNMPDTEANVTGFPAVGVITTIDNWDNVYIEKYDDIAKDLYEKNNNEPAVIKTTESPAKYHLRTWAGWPLVKMEKSYDKGEYTIQFEGDDSYYLSLNQGPFGKSFDGNLTFTGGQAVAGKKYRKITGKTKITWKLDNHDTDSYIFLKWSKTNNDNKGGGTLLPSKQIKLITAE